MTTEVGAVGHRVVFIIPARGGSQGVVRKNTRTVGGRSLIERAVRSTRATPQIDPTYVSTNGRRDRRGGASGFFGRTVAVEVPELTAIDIDTETDLLLAAAAVVALDSVRDIDPVDAIDVDVVITDFDGDRGVEARCVSCAIW